MIVSSIRLAWFGCGAAVVGCSMTGGVSVAEPEVTVTVDAGTVHQTMEGFGATVRLFQDPHLIGGPDEISDHVRSYDPSLGLQLTTADEDEMLDKVYLDMGLTRARPATLANVEPVNDNADPNVTDLSTFNFTWKRNDGFIDLMKRVIPRGVDTYFLSPVVLESWMNEGNPEEYVEWAMVIIRRWRDQGVELPYYSIMNEPGYPRGGIWSGQYIRDVIKLLGPKLQAEGFNTGIVIPDDLNPAQASGRTQVILEDAQALSYVKAIATHLYDGSNLTQLKNLSDQYGIPVWMTEWWQDGAFNWANTMHDLIANYNVTAVDHMWALLGSVGFDEALYVKILFDGQTYLGYELTKKYYTSGQFSRFVKAGAQRVQTTSTDGAVKVTAYVDGSEFVLVALNNASGARTVQFNLTGLPGVAQVRPIRTSQTEDWAELSPISVSGSSFSATLSAGSITTFITPGIIPGNRPAVR